MAHRYGHLLPVVETEDTEALVPVSFTWRGTRYRVQSILATWHLRDRWWEAGQEGALSSVSSVSSVSSARTPSDRTYYRVLCTGALGTGVFELYRDATAGRWVLDRALD